MKDKLKNGQLVGGDICIHFNNGWQTSWSCSKIGLYWEGKVYELETKVAVILSRKAIPVNSLKKYFEFTGRIHTARKMENAAVLSDNWRWPVVPNVPKFIEKLEIVNTNPEIEEGYFEITHICINNNR